MTIDDLRKQIDEVDNGIIDLISRRMAITRDIGREKMQAGRPIEDKARERAVLENLKKLAGSHNLNPVDIERIYQEIFTASKELQGVTVAFQGEAGAYSEEAAYQFFGSSARLKPCESLEDAFQAVEKGQVQYGLVPVENSLEGSITRTWDLLLDSSLRVGGEIQLRVVHCLIGMQEAQLDDIREVYSHPQALGQCKTFLRQMGWKTNPAYDTAGSVKMVKESGLISRAAVASARSAEIYGMKVLARGIEDNVHNFTRFFMLSRQDAAPSGNDRTSIVFSLKHKPGALYDALKQLASRDINLTRIESRPTRQKAWEYNFYVDIDGHHEDPHVKEALIGLESAAIFVKILGSYPRYK
jgi:chorismate mutase / prephenate dehydratase